MQEKQCRGAREEGKSRRAKERLPCVGLSLPTLLLRGACCAPRARILPTGSRSASPPTPSSPHSGQGDRLPKQGRGPSSPTHTGEPLTASRPHAEPAFWKKQPFPSHKRRITKNLEPLHLPATAVVFLNKSLPD